MNQETIIKKQSSLVFYGWYVLAASFVMLFFNTGAQFSIGVMFKPILNNFGWNRGTVSMVVFINMVVYAGSMLVMGKAYDRFGPKWVILSSATFMAVGFVGLSRMNTFLEFIVFYGVFCGVGFSGTTVLVFTSLISKWFMKWRGLVISVALAGGCLGQFILIPFYTDMIINSGWQTTCFHIGSTIFVVNVVLTFLIVKGDPDKLGYQPLGSDEVTVSIPTESPDPVGGTNGDFGLKQAAKTSSFWIFVLIMFVCGAGDFLVSTHLVPFVTDFGISQENAGGMLAWFGLFSLFGIIIAGPVSDLIGNKIPILITFLIRVLLFVMILNVQNKTTFYVFSMGFGFTLMITAVLNVTLVGKMFGFSNIGLLTGFITTIHHLGGGIFAYAGGAFFDATESYQTVFFLYMILSLVAVLACIFIREKRHVLAD